MDSMQTPTENNRVQNGPDSDIKEYGLARIEAMVTPEQVVSATVARKRRILTKKRSTSLTKREPTPIRNGDDKATTTSDEDIPERKPRPKTPERRRRRINKSVNKQKENKETKSEPEYIDNEHEKLLPKGTVIKKSNSIPKCIEEQPQTKESFTDLAHSEVVALFNKTKKSISAVAHKGRERFKKNNKERVKRSQSAPYQFTEEELIESFRKAQLLSVDDYNPQPIRKYSDVSIRSLTPDIPYEPKPFRPEVQEFVKRRRTERHYSEKIIEILDPKTSDVIATKAVLKPSYKIGELLNALRLFTVSEIYKNYKAYKYENAEEYTYIRIQFNKCMCELFLIIIFCGIGGMLFKFTEGTFENFYKCGVKRVKRDFVDLLWIKSHNLREEDWKSLARNRLRIFEEELHAAHEAGMTSYSGQRSWSFLNGIVYALTIITTIGYGHLYPTTTTGRALTIVYSLIGIPLFLIALTDFGKLFTRCIKFLWSFVRRLYYTGNCRSVRKTAHVKELFHGAQMMYEIATFRRPSMMIDPEQQKSASQVNTPNTITDETPTTPAISNYEIDDEFNLPISVAIFILLVYIFLGALIYMVWEDWDFFGSFYFVFISMSTIGFGDLVPRHPICMIISIVYLVFGLALMSMCINVVQLKLSDTFKHASQKIGQTIGIRVAEEDGSITTVPPESVEMPPVHGSIEESPNSPSANSLKIKDI